MKNLRAVALGLPLLVLGGACAHRGSNQTGAMGTSERSSGEQREAQAAAEPMFRPGPAVKGHASDEVVSGRIAGAQGGSISILTDQGTTETLQIAPETSVQVDGQDAAGTVLSEGLPVRASYNEVQGEKIAVEIWAGTPPSMSGTGSSADTGSSTGSTMPPAPATEPAPSTAPPPPPATEPAPSSPSTSPSDAPSSPSGAPTDGDYKR